MADAALNASPTGLLRKGWSIPGIQVDSTAADSEAFSIRGAAFGGFITPASMTAQTITFYGLNEPAGTFLPIYDSTGTAVAISSVTQGRCYEIPGACMSFHWLKMVSGTGDITLPFIITLKG